MWTVLDTVAVAATLNGMFMFAEALTKWPLFRVSVYSGNCMERLFTTLFTREYSSCMVRGALLLLLPRIVWPRFTDA